MIRAALGATIVAGFMAGHSAAIAQYGPDLRWGGGYTRGALDQELYDPPPPRAGGRTPTGPRPRDQRRTQYPSDLVDQKPVGPAPAVKPPMSIPAQPMALSSGAAAKSSLSRSKAAQADGVPAIAGFGDSTIELVFPPVLGFFSLTSVAIWPPVEAMHPCRIVSRWPYSARAVLSCPRDFDTVELRMKGFQTIILSFAEMAKSGKSYQVPAQKMRMQRSVVFRGGPVDTPPKFLEDWDQLTVSGSGALLQRIFPGLGNCRLRVDATPLQIAPPSQFDPLLLQIVCSFDYPVANSDTAPTTAGNSADVPLPPQKPVKQKLATTELFYAVEYDPVGLQEAEVWNRVRFVGSVRLPLPAPIHAFGKTFLYEPSLRFIDSVRALCPQELKNPGGQGPVEAKCQSPWTGFRIDYRLKGPSSKFMKSAVSTEVADRMASKLPPDPLSEQFYVMPMRVSVEQTNGQPLPGTLWLRMTANKDECSAEDVTRGSVQKRDMELSPSNGEALSIEVPSGLEKTYATGFALLHDKQSPLSTCEPVRESGGVLKLSFKFSKMPAKRQLIIVSPAQSFREYGYDNIFKNAFTNYLRQLKSRNAGQSLQVLEITEDRRVNTLLNGTQIAGLSDDGSTDSLLALNQRIRFSGLNRRALDDLNLVNQNLRGTPVGKAIYIVDSTQENFQSVDAGAVYEWTQRAGVELQVVSIGKCNRWIEFKGVKCAELPAEPAFDVETSGKLIRSALNSLEVQ